MVDESTWCRYDFEVTRPLRPRPQARQRPPVMVPVEPGERFGQLTCTPAGTEGLSSAERRKLAHRECECCGAWLTDSEKKPWGRATPRACLECVERGALLWPHDGDTTFSELNLSIIH